MNDTIGYVCKSIGVIEFCMLLAAAVICGDLGACFKAVGTAFASVNQMGWVSMVIMLWVIGSGWYKCCKWATSTVAGECAVVVRVEALSVGGQNACGVSVVLCQLRGSLPCGMLHAVIGATPVVMTRWLL